LKIMWKIQNKGKGHIRSFNWFPRVAGNSSQLPLSWSCETCLSCGTPANVEQ
jgi:hypothetical protein